MDTNVLKRQATMQAADNHEELKELQKQIVEYRTTIESTLQSDNDGKWRDTFDWLFHSLVAPIDHFN